MARIEDLTITQNTDVLIRVTITDAAGVGKDINDKYFSAQIKKDYNDVNPLNFNISPANANNGIIVMTLSATQSGTLDHTKRYLYDVKMYESGNTNVQAVLSGKVFVTPTVTQIG